MAGTKLSRLESLQHERPTKLINLIRVAWPQIRAALEGGHTVRTVHERLLEDGIRISYGLLTLYVKRLLREGRKTKSPPVGGHLQDERDCQPQACISERHEFEYSGFLKEGVPDLTKLVGRSN